MLTTKKETLWLVVRNITFISEDSPQQYKETAIVAISKDEVNAKSLVKELQNKEEDIKQAVAGNCPPCIYEESGQDCCDTEWICIDYHILEFTGNPLVLHAEITNDNIR